ncbi:MAG: peptidylprolyl isomerase [Planctomycetota bacterium]|nr:peptidylprolyl isomerase [Planctomycetota bacterium]
MLGFFRRYEKTFLLVIFAPALVSLGITGAVLSAFTERGDHVVGAVFGEPVSYSEFERVAGPYRRVNPYADEDMTWKFFTLYKAAQRAGISVSDAEIGERLVTQKRFDMAQHVVRKRLADQGITEASPTFRQKYNEELLKALTEALPTFDRALYREVIPPGMTVREFEAHERREALVGRYLDTLREMAAVTPDEVWKEYQEQHHRRVAELVSVEAVAHVPDVAVVDSSDPRFVTKEQLEAYFGAHEDEYEEPRRVALEVVGVALDDIVIDQPSVDELKDFFAARGQDVAGVTSSSTWDDLTDEQRDQVTGMLENERQVERADQVMSAVVDRLGTEPDLAAVAKAAGEATGVTVQHLRTELLDLAAVTAHPLVGSPAARAWFATDHEPAVVSDVFAGPSGWFVLRAVETKHARMPAFAEVEERVRGDYAGGSAQERRRFYDERKGARYQGEPRWKVEALVANDDDYVQAGDAAGAANERARKALQTFLDNARNPENYQRGFALGPALRAMEDVEKAGAIEHVKPERELTRAQLVDDEHLAGAADVIGSFEPGALSDKPYPRKDGRGWVVFRVQQRLAPAVLPFEEVEGQVAREVAIERGVDRARAWTERLSADLQGAGADEAKGLLDKRGLKVRRTEPFARAATSLEGYPDAGRIVAAAFEAEVRPGGPFARVVDLPTHPEGARVVLMRVAERVDADEAEFSKEYPKLRQEVLRKVRGDFAAAQTRRTFLEAKGIGGEHLRYVTSLRDGPGGQARLRLRQIFLPPDRGVIDAWLKAKALEKLAEAQAELGKGKSWEAVVDKFSEDDATRARRGELPGVNRGQLLQDFGASFEEGAFDLREGQISAPLESPRGWHLVKRVGQRGGLTVFSHLLVRTDPELRQMPQSVRDEAEQRSRTRMEEAQRRLAAGASFGEVAEATGDLKDPIGQGQPFDMDFVTPFERAALVQPLEWEAKDGSPEDSDPAWLPSAVELPTGADGASEWHLFACARDPYDRGMAGAAVRRDRQVFHIVSPSKDAADKVHARLRQWMLDHVKKEEERPSWSQILEQFKAVARESSRAPSAAKGGAVGLVQLEGDVRAYGDAFLDAACRTAAGAPVATGHRSAVVRSDKGYHLIEVVEVVTAPADREDQVADLVLRGTDWK